MTTDQANERRRFRRFELHLPVAVLGTSARAELRDISEGGLFIETDQLRPLGECMPLRLVHPDSGEEIPAVCQIVRHVHDADGALRGLGLRFANVDAALNERIRALIVDLAGLDPLAEPETLTGTDDDDQETNVAALSESDVPGDPTAVFDLDDAAWQGETEAPDGDDVDVVVLGGDIVDSEVASEDAEPNLPAVPIIWPDSRPRKTDGARAGFNPMQLRLLAFIDSNNTVAQIAHGAGIDLEIALQELSELAHEGRLVIPEQPTAPEEIDAWAAGIDHGAASLFPGRDAEREQRELWRKARALVAQGLAAERNNDFAEAAQLLDAALALNPPNRGNIHARLAVLAMDHLQDLTRAERHARAVIEAEPHRPHGERLLRRIQARQVRRIQLQRRRKPGRRRRVITQPRLRRITVQRRSGIRGRQLLALLATIAVLGVTAWNINTLVLEPRKAAPRELAPAAIADLLPAHQVLLQQQRLVVTVTTGWSTLSAMERQDKVKRLADWARDHHQVNEVLVADPSPRLLARVRDGTVTIFGPSGRGASRP